MELISIIPIFVSLCAILVTAYNYHHAKKVQTYANLDNLLLELLKLGLIHPKFRDPKYTHHYDTKFKDEELIQYEIYAYIAWNICETIYDRKLKDEFETWKPIIVAENKLHRKWFDNPKNFHMFKQEFRDYISEFKEDS